MNPPTPSSKTTRELPTRTLTPENAKTNNYASGFGNSRLAPLVSQAFDLRGTAYLPDASEAIVDEWRRLRMVQRHEENLWLEGLEGASAVLTAGKSSAPEPVDRAGWSGVAPSSPSTHLWWAA